MTFVLIISFILHAFSILAIIILYLRQNQYKQAEQSMEKLQKDVEAVLQSFLLEVQEENRQLEEAVRGKINPHNKVNEETIKVGPSVSSLKKVYQSAVELEQLEETAVYKPPMPDIEDQLELSIIENEKPHGKVSFQEALESQLKQQKAQSIGERANEMKKSGFTIEDIAKELGKGKTEIELLLKFYT